MKKRILSLIFVVVICLFTVLPAFADMGYIYYNEIEVTVSNPDGIVIYTPIWNSEETEFVFRPTATFIPYQTKLTVKGDYVFNGEIYTGITYRDTNGYIKLSELSVIEEAVGVESAYKTAAPRNIAVINNDGVYLRKGPGNIYEAASEIIEYGTILTYEYTNAEYESISTWAYVEHKGVGGWLYIYQNGANGIYNTAYVLDEKDYYTGAITVLSDGAYLTQSPNPASEKVVSDIPAGTRLFFGYMYDFEGAISAFVEYDGVKGWIETSNTSYNVSAGVKSGAYVLADEGMALYSVPFDESSKTDIVVPKNTNLPVNETTSKFIEVDDYTKEVYWLHTEYNGTEGWICYEDYDVCSQMYGTYDLKITAEEGADLYSEPDLMTDPVSVLPKDSVATVVYESYQDIDDVDFKWNYVECNGSYGWLITNIGETEYVADSENQPDVPPGAVAVSESFLNKDIGKAPELVENYLPIIIAACVAAVVLTVIITVVIILKKKKAKT